MSVVKKEVNRRDSRNLLGTQINKYAPQECRKIVTMFLCNNSSVVCTQVKFRQLFSNRSALTAQTIRHLAAQFDLPGSTQDRPKNGKPRTQQRISMLSVEMFLKCQQEEERYNWVYLGSRFTEFRPRICICFQTKSRWCNNSWQQTFALEGRN